MKWKGILFLVVFLFAVQPAACLSHDDLPPSQAGSHEMHRGLDLPDVKPAQSSISGIPPQSSLVAATPCECPVDPRISALCIACEGDLQEVQRLLKAIRSPNVTANGTSPLCIAANHHGPAIVQALLAAKADPNYRPVMADGVYGSPPLVCAASCGSSAPFQSCEAVVKVLLSAGADINQADSEGYTPLMAASSVGNLDMVMLLMKTGAHLNAATRSKRTALHFARKNGHLNIVTALLDLGAKE